MDQTPTQPAETTLNRRRIGYGAAAGMAATVAGGVAGAPHVADAHPVSGPAPTESAAAAAAPTDSSTWTEGDSAGAQTHTVIPDGASPQTVTTHQALAVDPETGAVTRIPEGGQHPGSPAESPGIEIDETESVTVFEDSQGNWQIDGIEEFVVHQTGKPDVVVDLPVHLRGHLDPQGRLEIDEVEQTQMHNDGHGHLIIDYTEQIHTHTPGQEDQVVTETGQMVVSVDPGMHGKPLLKPTENLHRVGDGGPEIDGSQAITVNGKPAPGSKSGLPHDPGAGNSIQPPPGTTSTQPATGSVNAPFAGTTPASNATWSWADAARPEPARFADVPLLPEMMAPTNVVQRTGPTPDSSHHFTFGQAQPVASGADRVSLGGHAVDGATASEHFQHDPLSTPVGPTNNGPIPTPTAAPGAAHDPSPHSGIVPPIHHPDHQFGPPPPAEHTGAAPPHPLPDHGPTDAHVDDLAHPW